MAESIRESSLNVPHSRHRSLTDCGRYGGSRSLTVSQEVNRSNYRNMEVNSHPQLRVPPLQDVSSPISHDMSVSSRTSSCSSFPCRYSKKHFCCPNNSRCRSDDRSQTELNSLADHKCYDYSCPPSCVDFKLRVAVKYFFMNPVQKFKAKKKPPMKLIIQLIKIAIVTLQLTTFASDRSEYLNFLKGSTIAFKNIYLKEWDPTLETLPYPPPRAPYRVYTIPEFYENIDYAMDQYNRTRLIALGLYDFAHYSSHGRPEPPKIVIRSYDNFRSEPTDFSYFFSRHEQKIVFDVTPVSKKASDNTTIEEYDIEAFLKMRNATIDFDAFISCSLQFSLRSIHFPNVKPSRSPVCVQFDVEILYDYSSNRGVVPVKLNNDYNIHVCNGTVMDNTKISEYTELLVLSIVCLALCSVSFCLTMRSLLRANRLRHRVAKHLATSRGWLLPTSEHCDFLNFFYVLIVVADILVIIGTGLKIIIDFGNARHQLYMPCSFFLGIATLFSWFSVINYLTYFDKYNVLIFTTKRAASNVARYIVCVLFLYGGFTFTGWVLLGPYHVKFHSLSASSECLFSLLNGDDMFMTFSSLQTDSVAVWYLSRFYLYSFILLFITVVLNLFMAILLDAYETVKSYSEHGFPRTMLVHFVEDSDLSHHDKLNEDANGKNDFICSESDYDKLPKVRGDSIFQSSNSYIKRMCRPCCRSKTEQEDDEVFVERT